MEFWGVEVKAAQPLKVKPDDEEIIHVSQATLGEPQKKGDESVPIYVKFGDKKLVLGTLSADKFPQISFDLVFEKEFELSHNWNGGSVYFMGYKMAAPEENDFSDMGTDSEDDDLPINLEENGGPGPVNAKPALGNAKAAKAKSEEKPKANAEAAKGKEKDSDSDENDDGSAEDDSEDGEGTDSEGDSDDDEEDSDEDDEEETPKKAEVGKKRSIESAPKTPDAKKAKLITPQKTDGKKGGQTATPHPAKQGAKNASSNKKQQQTPKSVGSVTCNSCSKTFNSESGLQSHSKAKHGAK